MNSPDERILQRRSLGRGRWLELEEIEWTQANGKPHNWEVVSRPQDQRVVMIVAHLRPKGQLLCVRQYRPALDAHVLEFPAGLVDHDESFEEAALRELREETGYTGQLQTLLPPRAVSSGICSERIATALIDIDVNLAANQNPCPQLEDSEDLETVLLDPESWLVTLSTSDEIDAKLSSYLLGLQGQALDQRSNQ